MAEFFDEPNYKKVGTGNEHEIPSIADMEGKPSRLCGCVEFVIKDIGEETPALDVIKHQLMNTEKLRDRLF